MYKEEFVQAKERIEESNKMKILFLNNINHEIRTPMNGLMGFVSLLKTSGLSEEKKMDYIKVIEHCSNRLFNLINDIITLSEIEAGIVSAQPKSIDVNKMLLQLFNLFNPDALKKKLILKYKTGFTDELCTIVSDEEMLYQILSRLLRNALKYTETGTITFGYFPTGKSLEFFVNDTGIGIHENKKEIIFDPFTKAITSDSRPSDGLGIGLSIVKSYIELLGGSIWVESELGNGTTFSFTIPLIRE